MADKSLSFQEIQQYQSDRIGYMQQMVNQFGNMVQLKMLWIKIQLVNDPDLVRELLIKHAKQLHRDPFTSKVFKRLLGNGVLAAEDESWKRQRKLVQPAFHAMRISNYTDVMAQYAREMMQDWQSAEARAIDQDLTQLTLRIIAKTMYNVDLADQTAHLGRSMATALEVSEEQLGKPLLPPKWVPTRSNRRQNKALADMDILLRGIVRDRIASGRDEGDLLSMLVQARDEDGESLSEQELVDECMTLFVAGHETTAASLTWTWYLLSQHPDVAQKLQAEIDSVLDGAAVTFKDLPKLPYTEMVIKEALRLYPPAWSFARTALEDIQLGNRTIEKGMLVFVSPYLLHRSADFYPAPERFWPERWAADQPQPHRYAYIPFGAGTRVCLGNMFAMMEARVILATMVQTVELALLSTEVVPDLQLTMRPKDPLSMRVTLRG